MGDHRTSHFRDRIVLPCSHWFCLRCEADFITNPIYGEGKPSHSCGCLPKEIFDFDVYQAMGHSLEEIRLKVSRLS